MVGLFFVLFSFVVCVVCVVCVQRFVVSLCFMLILLFLHGVVCMYLYVCVFSFRWFVWLLAWFTV